MRVFISLILIIVMVVMPCCYAQYTIVKDLHKAIEHSNKPAKTKIPKPPKDTGLCFPIEKDHVYNVYSYIIDLRKEKIQTTYSPIFARYNYEFTGYVWESILEDIIRKCPDKEIAENTFVKAQGDMVFFTITRYNVVPKFPSFICPVLCDLNRFEKYIKNADRNNIANY